MEYEDLILKTKKYVRNQFSHSANKQLCYHNLEHTEIVVAKLTEAIKQQNISTESTSNLIIAAWFHDIGYLYDYNNHEEKSIEICRQFLLRENINTTKINDICNIIYATKFEEEPGNEIEALLKDVDIAYALYTNFKTKGNLLKKEKERQHNKAIEIKAWQDAQIKFLKKIRFYSAYGIKQFTNILETEIKILS